MAEQSLTGELKAPDLDRLNARISEAASCILSAAQLQSDHPHYGAYDAAIVALCEKAGALLDAAADSIGGMQIAGCHVEDWERAICQCGEQVTGGQ